MAPKSLEGQTLGKYQILEPLGQGGMAQVYRAYHPTLDRYVAIKVLRADLVEESEFLARFSREARSVAALRHPNIVQVFDFDVQDGLYYMVMELLEGDTLKAYLNRFRSRGETIPLAEVVRILIDVLKGLTYAHADGIIHRDIKPANILLTKKGEAVVTDFGIAQIIGGTQYTVSGALMGTLHYMAPEQGMGTQVDGRSDIYSLGVVLYEMLTGHPPFDADTPLAILMKHLNDPLPLPCAPERVIPKPFERVVLKALAKQPQDRYQDAAAMMQALQEALAGCGDQVVARPIDMTATGAAGDDMPQVFSGTEREHITNNQFAADVTDFDLNQQLRSQTGSGPAFAATVPPAAPSETFGEVYKAAANLFSSVGGVVSVALNNAAKEVANSAAGVSQSPTDGQSPLAAQPDQMLAEDEVRPNKVGQAALLGVGLLVGYNLLALTAGTALDWWGLFAYGWSAEVVLVGLLLFLLMAATANIWLLIPAAIVGGNGLILAFCSITGFWGAWGVLWLLEPLLVGGSITLAVYLGKRPSNSVRRLARAVGTLMSFISAAAVALVGLGSLVASVLHGIFPGN